MNEIVGIEKVGRYELVRCLGEGAFGVLFLGFDPTYKRDVTIKIPLVESRYRSNQLKSFASNLSHFKSIDHPGVVKVYESGFANGIPFVASEYIDGPSLADWLDADQQLPTWQAAIQFLIKIATAVASIHEHGILHGDLKPTTILLDKTGNTEAFDLSNWNPKVSDFGFASQQLDGRWLYRNGIPLGSPRYLAPELFSNPDSPLSPTLDVYSFGIVMFEVLTGRHPFETRTLVNPSDKITIQQVPSLLEFAPRVPDALDDIVQCCLRKQAVDRYYSFSDLVEMLHSIRNKPR